MLLPPRSHSEVRLILNPDPANKTATTDQALHELGKYVCMNLGEAETSMQRLSSREAWRGCANCGRIRHARFKETTRN